MQGKQQGPQWLLLGRNSKAHLQQGVPGMALSPATSSGSTSGCSPPCIPLYLGCRYCLRGRVLSPSSKLIQVKNQSFQKEKCKKRKPSSPSIWLYIKKGQFLLGCVLFLTHLCLMHTNALKHSAPDELKGNTLINSFTL